MFEPMLSLFLLLTGIWLGREWEKILVERELDEMEAENDELREALLEKMK